MFSNERHPGSPFCHPEVYPEPKAKDLGRRIYLKTSAQSSTTIDASRPLRGTLSMTKTQKSVLRTPYYLMSNAYLS